MDQHLKKLLSTVLEADPDGPLDDEGREAMIYAMLAMHQREHLDAIRKFADSITNEFKRSHLLHKLATVSAEHPLDYEFAERIARSIPDPYWRFSAFHNIAAKLLKRGREFATVNAQTGDEFSERGLRLLKEVEEGLPSIPEDDGDRATRLWAAGLSLVDAGKLEWAETLAATTRYCPENTAVLLRSAKARTARNQIPEAIQLARTIAELAGRGTGDLTNRAFDLANVADVVFTCGDKEEARKYLEEAARFALASQEANDIDGCKCLGAIAIAFAKQGHPEQARKVANSITQPARREQALKKIAELIAPA